MIHGVFVRALFLILYNYCKQKQLGEVFQEMPFVLSYNSNWVKGSRVPDVMFFEKSRWDKYIVQVPDWPKKPAIIVPDLVVEVVSQNDSYSELNRKVQLYRQDGVKLIWVLDPAEKSVDVYEGHQVKTLEKDGLLTGTSILPNLEIKLGELFDVLDEPTEE